jgi:hypothetical protein
MILNWLRRRLLGFRVEDEMRRLKMTLKLLDSDEPLDVSESESNLPGRDIAEDDRRYEEVRKHTDEAATTLYRFAMQRQLRQRAGYHRNGV